MLLVKDLIEQLKQYDEDLPVYIYTDHGQSSEPVWNIYDGILDTEEEEMIVRDRKEYWPEEIENSPNLIAVVEISS